MSKTKAVMIAPWIAVAVCAVFVGPITGVFVAFIALFHNEAMSESQ